MRVQYNASEVKGQKSLIAATVYIVYELKRKMKWLFHIFLSVDILLSSLILKRMDSPNVKNKNRTKVGTQTHNA